MSLNHRTELEGCAHPHDQALPTDSLLPCDAQVLRATCKAQLRANQSNKHVTDQSQKRGHLGRKGRTPGRSVRPLSTTLQRNSTHSKLQYVSFGSTTIPDCRHSRHERSETEDQLLISRKDLMQDFAKTVDCSSIKASTYR